MRPRGRGTFPLGNQWTVALVAALALALRLIYVLEVREHPYYETPLVDAADYHAKAMQVMRGEGLGSGIHYKAPAYPFLLGLFYKIFGPNLFAAYVFQMLCGVAVCALTSYLAGTWFSRPHGLLAGITTAVYTTSIYFENQALIVAPALLASVLAVAVWDRGRTAAWDIVAGVCLGLAIQLRPLNLFLLAAIVLWTLCQGNLRRQFRRLAFLVFPILLILIPTMRHNRQASGEIVPISVNGGINFYIGNNPDYDETVAIRPGLAWEELTKRFGSLDDPVAWQRNFYSAAFAWMRENPWDAARLLGKKLLLFWNIREIDRNQDSSVLRSSSWVLRWGVPWGVLSAFALIGSWVLLRHWRRVPLHFVSLLLLAGVVAFFVTTRYRLALLPWVAILAAGGMLHLRQVTLGGDRRRRLVWGAALLVVLIAIVPDYFALAKHDFGRPHFDMAQVLARRGDREGALVEYERAVTLHPEDADVHFRYGEHLERMGRRQEAITVYARTTKLAPASYKPALTLAAAHILEDNLEEAWRALEESQSRGDPTGRTFYNMGLVRERQGLTKEALEWYRRSLTKADTVAERIDRHFAVGRCLILLGQSHEADRAYSAAETLIRDSSTVWLEKAEAWVRAGNFARGLSILQRVANLDQNARAQYIRARALYGLDRREDATAAAARAARLEPEHEAYRRLLERLGGAQENSTPLPVPDS